MPIDLENYKPAYKKWVEESLPDFRAGKMTEIVKKYPFIVSDAVPWTPYRGRPSEQTFALVTSGGIYLKNSQPSFDTTSIHGDPSIRKIPKAVTQEEIGIAHAHYDHGLAEQDINVIFPIHRLIELEKERIISRLTDTHYSFSYVNNVVPLVTETVPKLISRLKADGVDVLLLVPV
jgi:glycine/betaine/sarcosine/D-proline reductase family selenoprotein B